MFSDEKVWISNRLNTFPKLALLLVLGLLVLPTVLVLTVSTLGTAQANPSAAPVNRAKGWVWVSVTNADSTPNANYQYNSSGGTNVVRFRSTGQYQVQFPGLAASGGMVQVSAYGGNHHCKVVRWYPSGSTQNVEVRCFDPDGNLTNGRFTALFYVEDRGSVWRDAYLWADRSSGTPSLMFQWNSRGHINSMRHLGTGRYQVRLPGMDRRGGTVLVTAYGSGPEQCKVAGWSLSDADTLVNVRCFNASGNPINTRYTLSYLTDVGFGIQVSEDQQYGGYVWANQLTSPAYTPSRTYQYNNTGSTNEAGYTGEPGQYYRVRFPNLEHLDKTTAIVTAYGSDASYCTVDHWWSDGARGTEVYVGCYNARGEIVRSRFTLTYLTDEQILY